MPKHPQKIKVVTSSKKGVTTQRSRTRKTTMVTKKK